jgi:hypothetical protein
MADTTLYVTAGLPIAKDSGQSPTGGDTTLYVTAGLPKVVESAEGLSIPVAMHHYKQMMGAN